METNTVKICGLIEVKYSVCGVISGTKRTKGGGVPKGYLWREVGILKVIIRDGLAKRETSEQKSRRSEGVAP